jgi:hypothetical protein
MTFGIITDGNSDDLLFCVVQSIHALRIKEYEVVIIGQTKILPTDKVRIFQFDEEFKKNWITKKKNMIATYANFENIVFLHDYVMFDKNWYKNFRKIKRYKVAVCQIVNLDGSRFRDWLLWVENYNGFDKYLQRTRKCLLPYDVKKLTKFMYISGTFWVAKKKFMLENPLNEELTWGQAEDIEWSLRVREKTKFRIQPKAKVRLLKQKDVDFIESDNELVAELLYFSKKQKIRIPNSIDDPQNDLMGLESVVKINFKILSYLRKLHANVRNIFK